MKKNFRLYVGIVLTLIVCGWLHASSSKTNTPPVIQVDPDDITVLMGSDAKITGGLNEFGGGAQDYGRFFMQDWRSTRDKFTWTLDVPKKGNYEAVLLIRDDTRQGDLCNLELSYGSSKATHSLKRDGYWNRQPIQGTLNLRAGRTTLVLRATSMPPKANLKLHAIELTLLSTKKAIQKKAEALRSSTEWMVKARYGVMFHWTFQSKPRTGKPKSYELAVQDFDVKKFVNMVKRTGAGFVVFTTSHADYYFPAPIKAIDKVIPGRTTKRDLVKDLANELGKHNIKLILYYHPGHDDVPYWSKTRYSKQDKSEFFDHWCSVVGEVGERYGEKLAGWWFDDGLKSYYPYKAPWEKMTMTAKKGNRDRVVGYNAWILPKVGDFQDLGCGEGDFASFFGKEFVPIGGTGHFTGGPNAGLQALITIRLEPGDWCHREEDQNIRPSLLSQERLNSYMRACVARRVVPIINLEVYQDGTASPKSVVLLENMGNMVRSMKHDTSPQLELDLGPSGPVKGEIRLEAADGKSHGTYPIYIENVDCFTYWDNRSGKVSWSFVAPESGRYTVYSFCTHGRGPGEYQVNVGDQIVKGRIIDTGAAPEWEGYEDVVLGEVELVKGRRYDVIVTVNSITTKGKLMNLRRVSLRPVVGEK